MEKFLTLLLAGGLTIFAASCASESTTDNGLNNKNVNSAVVANAQPTADNSAANSTIDAAPAVADVPVPTFTDTQTALAEGNKYLDANATEKAIDAYNQALKIDPEFAEGYFRLGIAYLTLENERKAAQIDTEETPAPTVAKSKTGAKKSSDAALTDSDKAFEKAVKAYEKTVKKDPKDDAAFFNMGRSYNKLNKDREAEKALSQAAKLKPEEAEYQVEYGAILVKLAQYERAIPVLKKALAIDENNSKAQDLLEKAESGKKRIDFGVDAKAKQIAAQRQQTAEKKPVAAQKSSAPKPVALPPPPAAAPPIKQP